MHSTGLVTALFVAFIFLAMPPRSVAQEPEAPQADTTDAAQQPVRLRMRDGSEVVGTVEQETADAVQFRTLSGVVMTVPRAQIKSMERLEGRIIDGEYLRIDPNRTRLLFAPTARALGNGRGYFATYEIFFPFVAYGAGDVVSLAGGVSLIPGASGQLVYAAPKVTLYERPGRALAVGGLAGTFVGDGGGGMAGILFGLGTFGGPERSLTLGAGWGFVDDELADRPALLAGGEWQLSNSLKLISENYLVPGIGEAILLSGGVRIFGDHLAADIALITIPEAFGDGFPFFPWVGFAYNFGR